VTVFSVAARRINLWKVRDVAFHLTTKWMVKKHHNANPGAACRLEQPTSQTLSTTFTVKGDSVNNACVLCQDVGYGVSCLRV
jgi:hypothetical protein